MRIITKGQISFNADTFSKALIDDSDKVYKALAGYSSNYDDKGMFEKLKKLYLNILEVQLLNLLKSGYRKDFFC